MAFNNHPLCNNNACANASLCILVFSAPDIVPSSFLANTFIPDETLESKSVVTISLYSSLIVSIPFLSISNAPYKFS